MALFIFLGVIFLIFGALFLFAPILLIKLSELGNKLIYTDHNTIAHRYVTGMVLTLLSALMFYLGIKL